MQQPTVDVRNAEWPDIYYATMIPRVLVYELRSTKDMDLTEGLEQGPPYSPLQKCMSILNMAVAHKTSKLTL